MALDLRIGALVQAYWYTYLMRHARISVVIPAHNEAIDLPKTLESLLCQIVLPAEVIVVDNASTDETARVAKTFQKAFAQNNTKYHILSEPILGVARARNTGFFAAKYPIIASTDADTCVSADWIQQIQRHFFITKDIAVGGDIFWKDSSVLLTLASHMRWFRFYFWITKHLFKFQSFATANCAVQKKVFCKTGGFDTTIVSSNNLDDFEFSYRLRKFGLVGYDSKIVVYSSRRYNSLWQAIHITMQRWKRIFRILKS